MRILIATASLAASLAVAPAPLDDVATPPPTRLDSADAPALQPGQIIRLTFPDLPPTLFAMVRGSTRPEPAVSIRLPDNYTPDRPFPLFAYIGPNDGGVGTDISDPIDVVGLNDYIVLAFPIFRRSYDPTETWGIAPGMEDYPVMRDAYAAIMARIREAVPNIDPASSVIGGYSNGAHTLAVLLSALDETMLESFGGFFFVDAGFQWTSYKRPNVMGKYHILFLTGGGTDNPEWWRQDIVNHVRHLEKCAKVLGVDKWRFVVTPGVGHAFPDEYDAILREWVVEVRATADERRVMKPQMNADERR